MRLVVLIIIICASFLYTKGVYDGTRSAEKKRMEQSMQALRKRTQNDEEIANSNDFVLCNILNGGELCKQFEK